MQSLEYIPRVEAYKFFNSAYLESLTRHGRLRVGTAAEYRVPDEIDAGRADPLEVQTIYMPPTGSTDYEAGDVFLRRIGMNLDFSHLLAGLPRKPITVVGNGASFILRQECYMFCMSRSINNSMKNQMKERFNCDMYFRVKDLRGFMSALCSSDYRLSPQQMHGGDVHYVDSPPWILREFSFFEKRKRFEWQDELRAVWSNDEATTGFLVDVRGLTKLISIHEL